MLFNVMDYFVLTLNNTSNEISLSDDNGNKKSFYGKKNKIGVVVPSLEVSGGVQAIVEMLIKQIEGSEKYDYLLVSLATGSADDCSTRLLKPFTLFSSPKVKNIEWRGRRMIHVGCSLAELEFMRYRQRDCLNSILSQCDLVQVVGGFPSWGASVLNCGKPIAVWAATRCVWERSSILKAKNGFITYWRRLMTAMVNRLDDLVIREADSLMVMNPLMLGYANFINNHCHGTVVNAPPGVDTTWFVPCPNRLSEDKDCYILSVARFGDPRKNAELLLDAYALLRTRFQISAKLILAGASPPSDKFWKKVDSYGLIDWVTFRLKPSRLQLRDLYQGALCFALSSDEEGFGMVIVEAMSCGVPVVSTRCGGPDGIISTGEEGYLVEVGDAAALAEKLSLLCTDMNINHQMGLKARDLVVSHFSEQVTQKIFFDTWGRLLAATYGK